MLRGKPRTIRPFVTVSLLVFGLSLVSLPRAGAQGSCEDNCYIDYNTCTSNCQSDCYNFGICDPVCYDNCSFQYDSCLGSCNTGLRTGMTWTVLGQQDGYVHVGADSQTNAYAGDTTVDQFLSILCGLVDGRAAPSGITFDFYNGWARGAVQATPPIAATVLTSQQQGDEICADTFGVGWRLAEFHDGRYGSDFSAYGGWSFWAAGQLTPGTRFWTAINDQPANPWNSAGDMPASVAVPKFMTSDAPVPNQYLATFSESTPEADVQSLANSLVATYGGSILEVFSSVPGFSFTSSDAQAQAMSQDYRIESVEQDTYGQPSIEYWHRDRIDQHFLPLDNWAYSPRSSGAATGVNIYVLDTGFRSSHQEFGGRARQDRDFTQASGSGADCYGHGTAVGSVASGNTVGVANGATLISIRISGCQGTSTTSIMTAALDWVAHNHTNPAVANVSFGGPINFLQRWLHLPTPIDRAVKRAVQAGVTVVVAAGNDGRKADWTTPARAAEAITVSATDSTDTRPWWANYGKVNLFAPGVGIRVASLAGDNAYTVMDGTSFSSPAVAGAAAIYLHDHPAASPSEVRTALVNSATPGLVNNPGSGSANLLLYVGPLGNLARNATASASTTYPGYSPGKVNDGDQNATVGGTYSWVNDWGSGMPQWVQLCWPNAITASHVELYTTSGYPIRDYDIQYWTGATWVSVATVNGNTSVHRTHTFTPVTTSCMRALGRLGPNIQPGYVRVNEFEVY